MDPSDGAARPPAPAAASAPPPQPHDPPEPGAGHAPRPPWAVPLAPPPGERPRPLQGVLAPPRPAWPPQAAPPRRQARPQAPPPWSAPPAQSPPARRWGSGRRRLAVLAGLLVLLLLAVAVVARPARQPVAGPRLRAGRAAAPALSDPVAGARRLLRARARAILAHDKAAFLAGVDRRRAGYYASQSRLFDRMRTAPFAAFNFRIVNPQDDLAAPSVRRRYAPARIYVPEVEARYRFVGQDNSPVLAHFYYTFALTSSGWRIAGQGDARPFGTDDVEIWDAGDLHTVGDARTLVVYHPGDHLLAERLLAAAARAYGQIAKVWSQPWEQKVVILVPRDQDEAERVIGAADLSRVAAVSSSSIESVRSGADERVLGNRIIVNTTNIAGYDQLNLQVVTTHEMTHVATRRVGGGVPLYLVEGFADYTALRPVDAPLRVTRPALARQVDQGGFDGTLPSDQLFRGDNDGAVAYDEGSSFCLWVARTYGGAKLQALYRSFGGGERPSPFEQDVHFRQVLGITLSTAETRWAAWVRRQL